MRWKRTIAIAFLSLGWILILLIGFGWYYAFQSAPFGEALLFCITILLPGLLFVLIGKWVLKRVPMQRIISRKVYPLKDSIDIVFEDEEVQL